MTDWCVRRAKQRQRNICYTSRLLTQCEMVGNTQKSILWSISDMLNHVIQSSTLMCKEQKIARVNWQPNTPIFRLIFHFCWTHNSKLISISGLASFFPCKVKVNEKNGERNPFLIFFSTSLERWFFIQRKKIFPQIHL